VTEVRTGNYYDEVTVNILGVRFAFRREGGGETADGGKDAGVQLLYNYESIQKKYKIGAEIVLPIETFTKRHYECKIQRDIYSIEEARDAAARDALAAIMENLPDGAKVISVRVSDHGDVGEPYVEVTAECLEEIGEKRAIAPLGT
jgi:hypothetical protein